MSATTLVIQHVEGSNPCEFRLLRHDLKSAPPVSIASPYEFPIENQPNIRMMARLRWYLEEFLEYPFPPETNKADAVLDALKGWGTQAFNALFDRRDAPAWLIESEILQEVSWSGRSAEAGANVAGGEVGGVSWWTEFIKQSVTAWARLREVVRRTFNLS